MPILVLSIVAPKIHLLILFKGGIKVAKTKTPSQYVANFVKIALHQCMKDEDHKRPTEQEVKEILDEIYPHPFLKLFGDKDIVFWEYPDSTLYAERFARDISVAHLKRGDEKTIVILEASALLGRWSKELSDSLKKGNSTKT